MARIFFPFVLKNPQLRMYGSSSSCVSAANCSRRVVARVQHARALVHTLVGTLRRQHGLDTSSSNGDEYSSAGLTSG